MDNKSKGKKLLLNGKETDKLLSHVRSNAAKAKKTGVPRDLANEALIDLLFVGLRPKEICNLNIGDLKTIGKKKYIVVNKSMTYSKRKVVITKELFNNSSDFIKLFRQSAKKTDPLVANENGNRLSSAAFYQRVRYIRVQAGVKIDPSIIRRTYAMLLYIHSNGNMEFIHKQLGYSNIKSTHRFLFEPQLRRMQKHLGHKNLSSTLNFLFGRN